jgi:hypothetical protein
VVLLNATARIDLRALFYVTSKTGIGFSHTGQSNLRTEDLSKTTGLTSMPLELAVIQTFLT